MRLRFTKMHGLGNDFIVIDGINQRVRLTPERVRRLADRRFGVGCDQILVVDVPSSPEVDFCYRIFNEDGSEVENCGNGARCFAKFVRDAKLTGKSSIVVETSAGRMTLNVLPNGDVTVNMGAPELEPERIPFVSKTRQITYDLDIDGTIVEISAVSMGNPHAVNIVDDVAAAPIACLGPQVESHPQFPKRVNAGFMAIKSPQEIDLRVYERGVGETLACGTGACAAVVAGRLRGLLDETVRVNLPGGSLQISWRGEDQPVLMTGPAETVFVGQIQLT